MIYCSTTYLLSLLENARRRDGSLHFGEARVLGEGITQRDAKIAAMEFERKKARRWLLVGMIFLGVHVVLDVAAAVLR